MHIKCVKVKYMHCRISFYLKTTSVKLIITNIPLYFLLQQQFLEDIIKTDLIVIYSSWMSPSLSVISSNSDHPLPKYSADCLGSAVYTVHGSQYLMTTFTFIFSLLSTPHNVSHNQNNWTSYNPSVIQILCSWNMFVCAANSSCFYTVTGLW
jgi:hypothetical protein